MRKDREFSTNKKSVGHSQNGPLDLRFQGLAERATVFERCISGSGGHGQRSDFERLAAAQLERLQVIKFGFKKTRPEGTPSTAIEVDICVNNRLALANTKLLKESPRPSVFTLPVETPCRLSRSHHRSK